MNTDHLNHRELMNVCFTFLGHFDRYPGADKCWEFQGTLDAYGYGQHGVKALGLTRGKSHRIMWLLVNGELDDNMDVLHRCDNPPCCNPAHLYLGTQTDNIHDQWARGRARVWGATLTPQQVQEIRDGWKFGSKAKTVAKKYGVTPKAILNIVRGKSWSFLGTESGIAVIRATPLICTNCGKRWMCSSERSRCRDCGSLAVKPA